jgi:trigger factor
VPEKVVEAEVNAHLEGEDRVADDDHRSEITEEVTKALRVQLVLDAVAEAENVSVGQNELVEYLVQQSRMYGLAPQEFMERVQQANQLPTMLAEIARRKGRRRDRQPRRVAAPTRRSTARRRRPRS